MNSDRKSSRRSRNRPLKSSNGGGVLKWYDIGPNHNISGYCKPGELFAFLGHIAHKSKILKQLSGLIPLYKSQYEACPNNLCSSKVLFNDVPLTKDDATYIDAQCADVLYENLTVLETIMYAAELRSIERVHASELIGLRLLKEMGLKDIAERRISEISKWQKRMVVLAVEVTADYNIIFFDTPTVDLDASSSIAMIRAMQSIVRSADNCTNMIITSIGSITFREYVRLDRVQLLLNYTGVNYHNPDGVDGEEDHLTPSQSWSSLYTYNKSEYYARKASASSIYFGSGSAALPYFVSKGRIPTPGASISDFLMDLVDTVRLSELISLESEYMRCIREDDMLYPHSNNNSASETGVNIEPFSITSGASSTYLPNPFTTLISPPTPSLSWYETCVEVGTHLMQGVFCFVYDEDNDEFVLPVAMNQLVWALWRGFIVRIRDPWNLVSIWCLSGLVVGCSLFICFYSTLTYDLNGFYNRVLLLCLAPYVMVVVSSAWNIDDCKDKLIYCYERHRNYYSFSVFAPFSTIVSDMVLYRVATPILAGFILSFIGLQTGVEKLLTFVRLLLFISLAGSCMCKMFFNLMSVLPFLNPSKLAIATSVLITTAFVIGIHPDLNSVIMHMDQVRHYEKIVLHHGMPVRGGLDSGLESGFGGLSVNGSTAAEVSPTNVSLAVKPFDLAELSFFNKVRKLRTECNPLDEERDRMVNDMFFSFNVCL